MSGLDNQQQAKCVTEHYSSISNQYQQVQASDFQEYLSSSLDGSKPAPNIETLKVYNIIHWWIFSRVSIPSVTQNNLQSKKWSISNFFEDWGYWTLMLRVNYNNQVEYIKEINAFDKLAE